MINKTDIRKSYWECLGRLPENDAVVDYHSSAHATVESFISSLKQSDEYKSRCGDADSTQSEPVNLVHSITPATLDTFVACSDKLGPVGSTQVNEYWKNCSYFSRIKVDENNDPFGEDYTTEQINLYKEISGRDLDQESNEMTIFYMPNHVNAPNPYGNYYPPSNLAIHMGRTARVLEHADLKSGSHVLDLGCGWGATSELLAFAGLKVTGIDINPKFVDLVNQRAVLKGHAVSAIQGSFDDINTDDLYDAALFYESLHHAVMPWIVLEQKNRKLRLGGKLLLAGEPVNQQWKHWGLRFDPLSVYCIRKFGWFESGWSIDFISKCVERSGFAIERFADEGGSIGWVMIARKVR